MIYLNCASTTRPDKEVLQDFMWCAENHWANPSDISTDGMRSKEIILHAQEQVADYIGAKADEIVFTSGGSESNNWAIKGYLDRYKGVNTIITTGVEHPSVFNTCKYLETKGYKVKYAPLNIDGRVDLYRLENFITEKYWLYPLVSIMMANNEIGSINNISAISKIVHRYGGLLHVDAVQAFGQIPINVKEMGIDMMSVSFHKFGGFKNCGFLYIKEGIELTPLIHGGHQFDGRRAGTENVPVIYALGNQVERMSKIGYPDSELKDYLCNRILNDLGKEFDVFLNGSVEHRLPNNISLTFKGINAESLITLLDSKGVCVSAGSACCAGTPEPSRVLKAIGLTDEEALSTVRISLGKYTIKEECDLFVYVLGECLRILKMMDGE